MPTISRYSSKIAYPRFYPNVFTFHPRKRKKGRGEIQEREKKNSFSREESFSRRAATLKKIILKPRAFRIATTSCVLAFSLPPFPSLTLVRRSTKYEGGEEVDGDIRSAAPRNPKIFATNSFFTARNAPTSAPVHPLKLTTRATMRREKNRGRGRNRPRAFYNALSGTLRSSAKREKSIFSRAHTSG